MDSNRRFWEEKVRWAEKGRTDNGNLVVRINGRHYVIGYEDSKSLDRGCGGRTQFIRFTEGEHKGQIFATSNLWYQGVIPNEYRKWLYDNAEFVDELGGYTCTKY